MVELPAESFGVLLGADGQVFMKHPAQIFRVAEAGQPGNGADRRLGVLEQAASRFQAYPLHIARRPGPQLPGEYPGQGCLLYTSDAADE